MWIDENEHLLKPRWVHQQVYLRTMMTLFVMVVWWAKFSKSIPLRWGGGSFLQLEGDITLKIIEDGKAKNIESRKGNNSLACESSSFATHQPTTIGLEWPTEERVRRDGLIGTAERSENSMKNMSKIDWYRQSTPAYYGSILNTPEHHTCKKNCGTVNGEIGL